MGVHWASLPSEDRIWERTQNWYDDRRLSIAYNSKDPLATRTQYGGVAIMAINTISHKVCKCGYDKSGLGRWTWMKIQGKHNTFTRIVSAYRPIKSNISGATKQYTVYAQHLRANGKDPLQAFWTDLRAQIQEWVQQGDNLVVCGDWNQPITHTDIKGFS